MLKHVLVFWALILSQLLKIPTLPLFIYVQFFRLPVSVRLEQGLVKDRWGLSWKVICTSSVHHCSSVFLVAAMFGCGCYGGFLVSGRLLGKPHTSKGRVCVCLCHSPPGLSISAFSFFVKTALFAILQSLWLKRNKQGQPWNEHVHKLFIVCLLSVVNECVLSWPHGPGFSHGPASSGAYLTFVRSRYAPESVNRIMCCFYLFYWNFFKFVAVEIEY